MKKYTVLLLSFLFLVYTVPALALTTTASNDGDALASALLGSGVSIDNVTYAGTTASAGFFEEGFASGIGIDEGIVLTSGSVINIDGLSNTSDSIGTVNGLSGDDDADNLIPGFTTNDATILSFDFVSESDAVFFNYVFGSEEYNEFVDSSYNDVFGFFVNDVNYALIPGTDVPVAINNVNNDSYAGFYNDNDPSNGFPTPFAFEYDGFTDVFTASILGLTAGQTYNIKMVIADAGDFILDSGVFLQAGSFTDKPPSVPEPGTIFLMGLSLVGLAGMGRKKLFKK